MEKTRIMVDLLRPEQVANALENFTHSGLLIMTQRINDFKTDTIAFGGCPGCLAQAIADKMRQDDNFATLITAAMELYHNPQPMRCFEN